MLFGGAKKTPISYQKQGWWCCLVVMFFPPLLITHPSTATEAMISLQRRLQRFPPTLPTTTTVFPTVDLVYRTNTKTFSFFLEQFRCRRSDINNNYHQYFLLSRRYFYYHNIWVGHCRVTVTTAEVTKAVDVVLME